MYTSINTLVPLRINHEPHAESHLRNTPSRVGLERASTLRILFFFSDEKRARSTPTRVSLSPLTNVHH